MKLHLVLQSADGLAQCFECCLAKKWGLRLAQRMDLGSALGTVMEQDWVIESTDGLAQHFLAQHLECCLEKK
jgi:hypothetical protein